MKKWTRRKICGLVLALALIILSFGIGFTQAPSKMLLEGACLLLAALALWITEALPMSITTMFMICMLAIENIMSFDEAIASMGVNTSLFIMASSGITVAVGKSNIPRLLTKAIVHSTNGNAKKMIFGLSFCISICSAFMSSLATCALFYGIILPMLQDNGYKPGQSNLGKCLMIAIPACAGIGGFMSPAGTPANILLMDILKNNNLTISFGKWCTVGFPIGLLAVGIFTVFLVFFIPPEPFSSRSELFPTIHDAFGRSDLLTVIIVSATIILWFLSGWIDGLNTTMIAVIGLFIMFLPGVNLLSWGDFSNGVNWDLVLTMGTVNVLMTGIAKTGLMNSISTAIMHQVSSISLIFALAFLSGAICLIRSFVPTTTAVVALLAPMLIEMSSSLNASIESLLFMLAFWTASALLVVYTEPIYLITYGSGYYHGGDLLKVGMVPCLLLSILTAILIPQMVGIIF